MVGLTLRNVGRNSQGQTSGTPWTKGFDQLFDEMDAMLVPFRQGTATGHGMSATCDIHETDADYLLTMDIPGVNKDDIQIEFAGNHVTISAERKQEQTSEGLTAHRLERSFGTLKRTFVVPDGVEGSKIQANCENGVLYLAIPKAEAQKPKRIEVGAGKGSFLKRIG